MLTREELKRTIHDKSDEFKGYIKKYITCPDWMFDDMKGE